MAHTLRMINKSRKKHVRNAPNIVPQQYARININHYKNKTEKISYKTDSLTFDVKQTFKLEFAVKVYNKNKRGYCLWRNKKQYNRCGPNKYDPNATIKHYRCSEWGCPRTIITKNDDPWHYYIFSVHSNRSHKLFTDQDIKIFHFSEEVKRKVRTGVQPHPAYKETARDFPDVAEQTGGHNQFKHAAYRQQQLEFGLLPRSRYEFKDFLERNKINGNYYDQKLSRKDWDESKVTEEMLEQWQSRSGPFYLGDMDTRSQCQIFCPRFGAQALSTEGLHDHVPDTFFIDMSYGLTPKCCIKVPIPYKGAVHIVAAMRNENGHLVPASVPCATILYVSDKPSTEGYLVGLEALEKAIWAEYRLKLNKGKQVNLITMSDLEEGLINACTEYWTVTTNKICAFHYGQRLKENCVDKGLSDFCSPKHKLYEQEVKEWYRMYMGMMGMRLDLQVDCSNALKEERKNIILKCKNDGNVSQKQYKERTEKCTKAMSKFQRYHQSYYMRHKMIKRMCHFRRRIRTNNILERMNREINELGKHLYLSQFVYSLAKWYEGKYVKFMQYHLNKHQNQRKQVEILKNELLERVSDYQDAVKGKMSKEQLLMCMKYCSIAFKGDKKEILEIFKRKRFWHEN